MKRLFAAMGLAVLVAGCNKSDVAFEQLKKDSMQELRLKTQANTGFGLGKFDHWDLDQSAGLLVFSNADGSTAKCPAQVVGTYNSADHSWLWAWANPSVIDSLKTDSLKVKNYGERNGFKQLTQSAWEGSVTDAWSMAAIACKVSESQGIYQGPGEDNLSVFISFGKVELGKAK
jgi:hypothetical protein